MEKVVIFGAGSFGLKVYNNIKFEYEVQYFCDNDMSKWESSICGIKVISPEQLKLLGKDIKIIVASTYYYDIIEQLVRMNMHNIWYISYNNNIIQKYDNIELNFNNYTYIIKKEFNSYENKIKKVLFVQDSQCIRTYKIAKVLNENGIEVDIAYLSAHPVTRYNQLNLPYTKIFKINNVDEFINFINNSDYDIIHSSNEPDFLTSLLTRTNKAVIHDCHDMMSLRGDISYSDIINEYIANKYSDGNIYIDYPIKDYAVKKFGIGTKPILVLNNYTLKNQRPKKYFRKLSENDGEIHCVYEGGLSNDTRLHRYLEDKFMQLAKEKIHVHFYTVNEEEYYENLDNKNKYIHWEKVCSPNHLIEEMTKYDVGLVFHNVNIRNRKFLSSTFPNKIFEYLNAGIPVAVEKLPILLKFVEETKCGKVVDFKSNLYNQINNIKNIKIAKDFVETKKFTMEDQFEKILYFYNEVANKKYYE